MRSEFEKWFKTSRSYLILKEANYFNLDLFEFNESYKRYVHNGIQIAFEAYQHQQSKVDELQKRVDQALFDMNQKKLELREGCDGYKDPVEICQSEGVWIAIKILEQALKGGSDE